MPSKAHQARVRKRAIYEASKKQNRNFALESTRKPQNGNAGSGFSEEALILEVQNSPSLPEQSSSEQALLLEVQGSSSLPEQSQNQPKNACAFEKPLEAQCSPPIDVCVSRSISPRSCDSPEVESLPRTVRRVLFCETPQIRSPESTCQVPDGPISSEHRVSPLERSIDITQSQPIIHSPPSPTSQHQAPKTPRRGTRYRRPSLKAVEASDSAKKAGGKPPCTPFSPSRPRTQRTPQQKQANAEQTKRQRRAEKNGNNHENQN